MAIIRYNGVVKNTKTGATGSTDAEVGYTPGANRNTQQSVDSSARIVTGKPNVVSK